MRFVPVALSIALLLPIGAAAEQNDLREFSVGMPVSALPQNGYSGFSCTDDPAARLAGWADYRSCPESADGMRSVSFRYGNAGSDEDGEPTRVGGQAVTIAVLISRSAQVGGMRIDTDPNARLYLHKKAFLFALQVKARFGEDGWTCRSLAPTPTEQPVGGVFVHEHCEKQTATRHFLLDRQLFRDPAKDLRTFTDATQFTILSAGS